MPSGVWLRARYGEVAVVAIVVGIALVILSGADGFDWTRIIGAVLITAGGFGVGTRLGLAEPRRWPLQQTVRAWRRPIGLIAALLAVAPILVTLLALFVGLTDGEGRDAGGWLVALGVAVGVALLAGTGAALAVTQRAIVAATRATTAEGDMEKGPSA